MDYESFMLDEGRAGDGPVGEPSVAGERGLEAQHSRMWKIGARTLQRW